MKNAEQDGTGQPATRSQSKSDGSEKPQPESEGRSLWRVPGLDVRQRLKNPTTNNTMENKYTCLKCAAEQASGGVKKSFLGFPKFKCLKCGFDNLYPTSSGMIVIYVILALALIPMFKVASNGGGLFSPVLIFVAICGVIGITTNIRAKKAYQDRNKGDS